MAGANGRALTIDWDSVTLVGVRTKGYTITADYVDVTTDDDDGWRTLLADPGVRSVEVTVGGISSNQVLIAEKRAQANVIMRREETASTRSLLNTAKLMEENAMLFKLKEMEYVEKIAEKINTISVSGGAQIVDQLKTLFVR